MTASVQPAPSATTVPAAPPAQPVEFEPRELPIITDLFIPQGGGFRNDPAERSGLHLISKGRACVSVAAPSVENGVIARYRRLFQPADAEGRRRRIPHPGDILYWLTCLGAACLLLLAAT